MIVDSSVDIAGVTIMYEQIPCGSRGGQLWYAYEVVNEDTGRVVEDVTFQRSNVNNLERVDIIHS